MNSRPRIDTRERLALARAQLLRGWHAGICPGAEHVLTDFPDLTADGAAVADLVHTECVLRLARGQALDVEGLCRRFGPHADAIRRLLALDPCLGSEQATLAAPPLEASRERQRLEESSSEEPEVFEVSEAYEPSEDSVAPVAHAPGSPAPAGGAVGTMATLGVEEVRVLPAGEFPHVPGYEILGELGRGGMGVVYRARHVKLRREVALKMILAGSAGEMARFRLEAEALASLHHAGIVQIYEISEVDLGSGAPCPYFSLEFCPGGSLSGKLAGYHHPREAAGLVRTLALAIHAAHVKGIIHRDLKPANVLLSEDDTPKITDFGLARIAGSPGDSSGKTRTGAVMGTPSYMAPEQAAGKTHDVGPAADIYALGAILYECLTGRPPFEGPNMLDTLMMVMEQDPVPPRKRNARIPRDLETICLKCLEKNVRNRYSTAEELAEDLERHLADETIRARPPGRIALSNRWVRKHPALIIAYGILALIYAFLVFAISWTPAHLPGISTSVPIVLVLPMAALVMGMVLLAEMRWTLCVLVLLGLPAFGIARWTTLRDDPLFAFFVLGSVVGIIAVLVGVMRANGFRSLLLFLFWTLVVGVVPMLALLVFRLRDRESDQPETITQLTESGEHVVVEREKSVSASEFLRQHGRQLLWSWLAVMTHALILGFVAWLVSWAIYRETGWILFGALTGTVAALFLAEQFGGDLYVYMSSSGWRLSRAYNTLYLELCLAYTGAAIGGLLAPVQRSGDHVVASAKSTRLSATSTRAVPAGGLTAK